MKLSEATSNNTYTILSLNCAKQSDALRMSSLGFIPGIRITLLKTSPYKICAIGTGRVAISNYMANMINVKE